MDDMTAPQKWSQNIVIAAPLAAVKGLWPQILHVSRWDMEQ